MVSEDSPSCEGSSRGCRADQSSHAHATLRVLPQARIMNVTVRDGAPTSSWFNIACVAAGLPRESQPELTIRPFRTFEDLHQDEDLEGMIESQRQINALIAQERAAFVSRGVTPRIVVGGFSQGVCSYSVTKITIS